MPPYNGDFMAKTATPNVELEPIDRLEKKLRQLLGVVERLKAEQTRADDENRKLKSELEALKSRVASSESLSTELAALREERDVIRARVGEMLEQLDSLDV
jgi:regulator of replication initiation timing